MAVTKRTRFEVLRRDSHTCRYCGATAPDVKITVDHVTPTALGGTDDPTNLVAACRDCNSGKASSNPDAELVADVRDDAIRHAERVRQAYKILAAQITQREEYCDLFIDAWTDPVIVNDWKVSLNRFHDMGIPIEIVIDAAQTALAKEYVQPGASRFKYFCGVVWKKVTLVTDSVSDKEALEGAWMTEDAIIEERIKAYELGIDRGRAELATSERDSNIRHIADRLTLAVGDV